MKNWTVLFLVFLIVISAQCHSNQTDYKESGMPFTPAYWSNFETFCKRVMEFYFEKVEIFSIKVGDHLIKTMITESNKR